MNNYIWVSPIDNSFEIVGARKKDSVKYVRWDIVQGAMFLEPASQKKLKEALEASE